MAGSGDVVAHDLGRVLTQEKSACVLDLVDPRPRVVQEQAEVLRSYPVYQVHGFFQGIDQYNPSLAVQRGLGYFDPGLFCDHPGDFGPDLVDQFLAVGDQNCGGQRVVLRLGDEVGGAETGVGGLVGQNDGLGRAEDPVDVDRALDQFLGVGNKDVAGAADLVDLGHGGCAVGHGRDGRDPTHLVEGVHACDLCGDYDRRVQGFSPLRRRAENDLTDAGHASRNSRHQDSRGVGGTATWGVQANPIQRPDQLAQTLLAVYPVAGHRCFVEIAHPLGGQFQGFSQFFAHGVSGLGHLLFSHPEIFQVRTVQQFGVATDSSVAFLAHVVQHLMHRLQGRHSLSEGLLGAGQYRLGQRVQIQGVDSDQNVLGVLDSFDHIKGQLVSPFFSELV